MDPVSALAAALENVGGTVPSGRAVADIRDMYGSNAALAHALVRESGPVSHMSPDIRREYKTWMRDIQRWTKEGEGQKRSIRERSKIDALERVGRSRMQRDAQRQLRERGATVTAKGHVRVSGDRRFRDHMPEQDIPPAVMERVLDLWNEGGWLDRQSAFDALQQGFFDEYGIETGAYFDDVTELDFEIPE